MSQSSNPLRLVSWTWQWVHFTQMASTVTRSQSNRAHLGCGGTGDLLASWMCSQQICSNCVMLPCQYGPKSLRNVSNTLMNLCHEELRQFWRQKWVQPGTSKVYLIKWPVSVYMHKSGMQSSICALTMGKHLFFVNKEMATKLAKISCIELKLILFDLSNWE